MKKGIFIVLESLDGAGKSTVIQLLADQLKASVYKTPPDEFKEIRSLFDHIDLGHKPFYAATVALVAERIEEALNNGTPVICDRYWLSTKVYGAMRKLDICMDGFEAGLLHPDVTIYLHIDEATRRERMERRGDMTSLDLRSLDDAERLRVAYDIELAKSFSGKVLRIDTGNASPEKIVRDILRTLAEVGHVA